MTRASFFDTLKPSAICSVLPTRCCRPAPRCDRTARCSVKRVVVDHGSHQFFAPMREKGKAGREDSGGGPKHHASGVFRRSVRIRGDGSRRSSLASPAQRKGKRGKGRCRWKKGERRETSCRRQALQKSESTMSLGLRSGLPPRLRGEGHENSDSNQIHKHESMKNKKRPRVNSAASRPVNPNNLIKLRLVLESSDNASNWAITITLNPHPKAPPQLWALQLPSRLINPSTGVMRAQTNHYELVVKLEGPAMPGHLRNLAVQPVNQWLNALSKAFTGSPTALGVLVADGRVSVTVHRN